MHSLVWHTSDPQVDHYIEHLFFGPQLISLTLWCCELMQPTHAHFPIPSTRSLPNLTSVVFRYLGPLERRADLTRSFSDFICGLRTIEQVSTDIPLDRDAVRHLAASSCVSLSMSNNPTDIMQTISRSVLAPFPNLVSLSFNCTAMPDVNGLGPVLFPELRSLTCTCDVLDNVTKFIELLRPDKLQKLVVCHTNHSNHAHEHIE
jgi:hypothetical protein